MEIFISPARRRMVENSPLYFPFGGKQTRNILRDFKGSQSKQIQILFLNCQDLKNVLCTIASKTNSNGFWNMHLNHSCPVSLARNILILKVISADCFNAENGKDLSYVWDLWYNFQWPKSTLDRFKADIKELLEMFERSLHVEFCYMLNNNQLDELLSIWKGWLSALTNGLTQSSHSVKILKERLQFLTGAGVEFIMNSVVKYVPGVRIRVITGSLNELVSMREAAMGIEDYTAPLKRKLTQEVKHYFETGNCDFEKNVKRSALNPTLLEPGKLCWRIDGSSCPFDSYLPLSPNELETNSANECIATRYCQKELKKLLTSYKKSKYNVRLHFRWTEDIEICHIGEISKFDVVDCATLADDVGLANVILSGREKLDADSPDALLITGSSDWSKTSLTVAEYVEESLCTPLSIIPTLYGLRLADPIELGSASLQERETPPTTLNWHPAPRFENVPLGVSPSLERCLKNLEKMCFFMEGEDQKPLDKYCLNRCLTPLTLDFVTSRLAEQVGKQEGDRRKKLFQSKLPRQFFLAQKTLDDRANRRPVSLVTCAQMFTPVLTRLFKENKIAFIAPNLRIILVPSLQYVTYKTNLYATSQSSNLSEEQKLMELQHACPVNWAAKWSDVHYIDNFHLHYKKNLDGSIDSVYVAFLLPRDHGLNSTHCGALVDLGTGYSQMFLGYVKDFRQMEVEENNFTTKSFSPPPATVIPKEPYMKAINCQESENDYTVQIGIHTKNDPEGLSISTDQQLPCEAGHRITLCLSQPEGMKPLTMCFPHAFLVESIKATLRRSERSIRLVLKKAIREPWPCHFNEKPKLNVDQLSLWKEPNPDDPISRIMIHLGGTKDVKSIHSTWESALGPAKCSNLPSLEIVRNSTSSIFAYSEQGYEFFSVSPIHDQQKPLFTIRVHLPIKMTPLGSPMLLITAVDHRLAEKLIGNGNLQAKQFREDFQRLFSERRNQKPFPVWTTSEDATLLLRYILRLNASKMKPSLWQEENVPLGKFSPFLASFIAPLYMDSQYHESEEEVEVTKDKIRSLKKEHNIPLGDPNVCASCYKSSSAKMKRCSRCKSIYYCTVECQKADWSKHKIHCSVSDQSISESETMEKIQELVNLMMNSVR